MERLHEQNEELLREALVDLDNIRNQETRARHETESLLNGLRVLGRAGSAEQMFGDLLDALREVLAFEDAFVLTLNSDGILIPFATTDERFDHIRWQPLAMLDRVIDGHAIAAFDVRAIPEWQALGEDLRDGVVSALHAPLTSHGRVAILVCTHSARGAFTKIHVETVERFAPLVEQALVNAEAREATVREKELIHQRELAQRESQLKSEFLSTISHELRTPMNAVLGFGELLESEVAPNLAQEQQDYLDELLGAGRHLLDLIDGVLAIGRVDSGTLRFDIKEVDLTQLVPACLELSQPKISQAGVTVNDRVSDNEQVLVKADVYHLKQALLYLIDNAIKYNKTSGSLEIYCEALQSNVQRLNIRDSGIGLSEEEQRTVFEPFVRGDEKRNIVSGTGMGLPLAKRLIKQMAGEIGVCSEPGKGSVFWIELPTSGERLG